MYEGYLWFNVMLTFNLFLVLLPNVYYKYPNMDMQIDVQAAQEPGINVNSTGKSDLYPLFI